MKKRKNQKIDFYSMVGYCPANLIINQLPFTFRNLTDASDRQVILMQKRLIDFLAKKIFKLPKTAAGFILHSGTESNETALLLAKRKTKKNLVITSNISHTSIDNACKKLGLNLIKLEVDPVSFKVEATDLEKVIKKYGSQVAAINITYGTTKLGTGEDFVYTPKLEKICRQKKIWLHLDGAYGGLIFNLLGNQNREWQNSGLATSITVDPHKFIGILGCGVLLLTNPKDKRFIGTESDYFSGITTALGTTRSALPLATVLAMINSLGLVGLKKLAWCCHQKALDIANKLEKNGLTFITPIESGVIPIQLKSAEEVDLISQKLLGKGFKVSPVNIVTKNKKIFGIRIVITPKLEMNQKNLSNFTNSLIKIYKQLKK